MPEPALTIAELLAAHTALDAEIGVLRDRQKALRQEIIRQEAEAFVPGPPELHQSVGKSNGPVKHQYVDFKLGD